MHFDLQHDFAALSSELKRVGQRFPQVVAKGVVDATKTLFQEDRSQLSGLVYDQEETKAKVRSRKTGRVRTIKLWRRTSQLLRRERYYFRGSGAETEGVIDNSTPYVASRHERQYPAQTRYRTLVGQARKAAYEWRERPNRNAQWRDVALANKGDAAAGDFRDAIRLAENAQ